MKEGCAIHEISTKEYRHLSGTNKARYWNEALKSCYPDYAKLIHSNPAYKTASFTGCDSDLGYFWKYINILMTICATEGFLKWRFFQARMKQKGLDTLAKRLVTVASPQVLIAYGDWSRRDGDGPGRISHEQALLWLSSNAAPSVVSL
ncbi:hypothetical protein Gpo141_00002004 [Globisporangium polare]